MVKIPDSQECKINALVFKKFSNVSLEIFNGAAKAITLAKINAFEEMEDSREENETYEPKLAYYYQEELRKVPLEELEKLYQSQAKEIDALLDEEIKQKEAKLFNQPNMKADYEYWNKADYWSVEECLILTLEKEPRSIGHNYISDHRYYKTRFSGECYSEFAKKYDEIFGLIQRSIESGLLRTLTSVGGKFASAEKERIAPADYINWAKDKNITLPEELLKITKNKNDTELSSNSLNKTAQPSQQELSKTKYQITLSTKNTEPALYLVKSLGETKIELFCHILRKENATWFQELFENDKISLPRELSKKFVKTISNIFDKIDDKLIRSQLRDRFFEVTANSVVLKTTEISF